MPPSLCSDQKSARRLLQLSRQRNARRDSVCPISDPSRKSTRRNAVRGAQATRGNPASLNASRLCGERRCTGEPSWYGNGRNRRVTEAQRERDPPIGRQMVSALQHQERAVIIVDRHFAFHGFI